MPNAGTAKSTPVARVREPRISLCARVVIGAHDDLRVGMALPDHRGDRFEISGIEGNGDGIPSCRVNAGASGVALGFQTMPVKSAILLTR